MCGIEVSVSQVLFQSPHVSITILVKIQEPQVVNIGTFSMYQLTEEALACHIKGQKLKEIIAAVFQLHAMLPGPFRCFYKLPALFKRYSCRHLSGGMFSAFHCVNGHWSMPCPGRANVNKVNIRIFAESFPCILAAA